MAVDALPFTKEQLANLLREASKKIMITMNTSEVKFADNSINLDTGVIRLEYPILEAFALEDKTIILFEPDAKSSPGQFHNLVAISPDGRNIWKAELPTTTSSDAYYRLSSRTPLVADSLSSFSVVIDTSNGRIVSKSFYK